MPRSDRDERVDRLRKRAQERSTETFAAARRAIMALHARDAPVTIKTVAEEAGISQSYLAKNAELKQQINDLRTAGPRRPSPRRDDRRSAATLRTQLDAVHQQAKKLQTENERLRAENTSLRGALLEARRASRRTST